MQSDEIVLSVDHDADEDPNDLVTVTFTRSRLGNNKDEYIAGDHSVDSPHLLAFYRTDPKQSGTFKGQSRTAAKITKSVPVTNTLGDTVKANVIMEVSFSVPVSAAEADSLVVRQELLALLGEQAIMNDLVNKLLI